MDKAQVHHRTLIACYLAAVERRKQREHLLMHKYGKLFIRKVFPHGTSWTASKYHDLHLLRVAFTALKNTWWTERVSWRLEIRARCHRHLRFARRAFNKWVLYVRVRIADRHFHMKVCSHMLHQLQEICQSRRQLRLKASQLMLVYAVLTQRVTAIKLTCSLVEEKMDIILLALRKRRLLLRVFIVWKTIAVSNRALRRRLRIASDLRLQGKMLWAWWGTVELNRPARWHLAENARLRQNDLVAKCFRAWVQCWQAAVSRRALATQLQAEVTLRLLRCWLQCWRSFVCICHFERRADTCAKRALARRYFAALRKHVEAMAARRAVNKIKVLRICWIAWTNHVTNSWQERNAGKIQRADQRLRRSDLKKVFVGLQRHTELHRRKRTLASVAERHFALHWFGVWHKQWQLHQLITRLNAQADAFREFSCLREVLTRWQQRFSVRARRRDLLESATRLIDAHIVVRCLHIWHCWTKHEVSEKQRQEEALRYRDHQLTLTSWTAWTNLVAEQRWRYALFTAAQAHFTARHTRTAWDGWVKWRHCRLQTRIKLEMLVHTIDLRVARQVLQKWAQVAMVQRHERQRMADASAWHVRVVKQRVLLQLKAYAAHHRDRKSARRQLGKLVILVQKGLLLRCFRRWEQIYERVTWLRTRHQMVLLGVVMRQWVANHRKGKELKNRKRKLKEIGNRQTLLWWFNKWVSKLQQQSAHRLLESQATEHWRKNLLRWCLNEWLNKASAQRRGREAERKRAWLRVALRCREEQDQRALERMLTAAKHEFFLARKYVTRWKRRLARKCGSPMFYPISAEYIGEEFSLGGTQRLPRQQPQGMCLMDIKTCSKRPQPRIPDFMKRGQVTDCDVPEFSPLINKRLPERAYNYYPASAESWNFVGLGAGDASSNRMAGLLPPSFFES